MRLRGVCSAGAVTMPCDAVWMGVVSRYASFETAYVNSVETFQVGRCRRGMVVFIFAFVAFKNVNNYSFLFILLVYQDS